MLKKILNFISKHKIIAGLIVLVILIGGYYGYKLLINTSQKTKYTIATVQKGTIVSSVSGSGQVSTQNQIDIKPKVSGEVVYVGVKNGQEVKAGTLIAQLDTRNAQKAVLDAEIDLANAQLALKDIKGEAEESLSAIYEDGLNVLTNTFKDLSLMMPELKKIFSESSYGGTESDIDYYLNLVSFYDSDFNQLSYWAGGTEQKYLNIQTQIETIQKGYWVLSQTSPHDQTEIILNQTYDATRTLLDLVRQTFNLVQKYQVFLETENLTVPIPAATSSSQISQLTEFTSSLINYVDALSSIKSSLVDKKEAVARANVDMETQSLTVKQCEYALSDAKETLSQHYIHVPFDGIIADVNSDIKKSDSISASTVLATLITKQLIAEVTLNEVDAAKAKIGQKATLTFDAIEGLNITGKVAEIDTLGTVSQGVVTYNVKITFDTQEPKVKSGMSVTADIITDIRPDVLVVPNSAVKSQSGSHYVELVEVLETTKQQLLTNRSGITLSTPPKTQSVEIGLSNDSSTEIVSGLKEGDVVVTSTISSNTAKTTQTTTTRNQGFQIPGMGGR